MLKWEDGRGLPHIKIPMAASALMPVISFSAWLASSEFLNSIFLTGLSQDSNTYCNVSFQIVPNPPRHNNSQWDQNVTLHTKKTGKKNHWENKNKQKFSIFSTGLKLQSQAGLQCKTKCHLSNGTGPPIFSSANMNQASSKVFLTLSLQVLTENNFHDESETSLKAHPYWC